MNINDLKEKVKIVFSGEKVVIKKNDNGYILKRDVIYNISQELTFLLIASGLQFKTYVSKEFSYDKDKGAIITGFRYITNENVVAKTIDELEKFVKDSKFQIVKELESFKNYDDQYEILMKLNNSLIESDAIYIEVSYCTFGIKAIPFVKDNYILNNPETNLIKLFKAIAEYESFDIAYAKLKKIKGEIFRIKSEGKEDIEKIRNERDQVISDRAKKMYADIEALDASLASE